jgi:hypothetical protein
VILPLIDTFRDYTEYAKLPRVDFESFDSSNARALSNQEFTDMLKDDGWLESSPIDFNELSSLSKEDILQYFRVSGFNK